MAGPLTSARTALRNPRAPVWHFAVRKEPIIASPVYKFIDRLKQEGRVIKSAPFSSRIVNLILSAKQSIQFVAEFLWRWDVVAAGSLLLYGLGASAMYGDDYIVAAVLYLVAVVWLTAKVLTREGIKNHPERRGISVVIIIFAASVFGGSLFWIQHRNRIHLAERQEQPPKNEVAIATNEQAPAERSDAGASVPGTVDGKPLPSFLQPPPPPVDVSPSKLSFKDQIGVTSVEQTILVANQGIGRLPRFLSIQASGDFSQTNDCPSELMAGDSCNIAVTFTPTKAGFVYGSVEITLKDPLGLQSQGASTMTVDLSGYGMGIVERPSKPNDGATAVAQSPTDPTKKRLRQAMGNLINRGVEIRDKAPMLNYTPLTEDDKKTADEAHIWSRDVERFLRGNFDAAEAASFKALDDDPEQSLNGKLRTEIQYLMNVLNRPEMRP